MTRLGILLALLCTGAVYADCNFGECSSTPEEAFNRDKNRRATIEALRTAFNTADSNDNDNFNGIDQRLNDLKGFREAAKGFADDVNDSGASDGQVRDMKAQFDLGIERLTNSQEYFQGKRDRLNNISLADGSGVPDDAKTEIRAMKTRLREFIEKWDGGIQKLRDAKAEIRVGKSKDECRASVKKFEDFINDDLKPAFEALDETIDPVQDHLNRSIEGYAEFQCECGSRVTEFILSQQQAQIDALAQDNQALRDFLTAQGFQGVPASTVPQSSLDDTDGPGGSAPAGSPPASSPPPSAPPSAPPGDEGPSGRALSAEEARGGLGAIAAANCAPMGYDCSTAAIYGPGGMVSVLAQHITNREVSDPNVIFAGDIIDFAAVDAANN